MKKYLEGKRIVAALLAVIVTLTSLSLSAFAGTSELLTNGTFGDGSLDGWTTQGEVETSSDSWISGDYAVLSGETGLASLQSEAVDVVAEKNYVISASVRDSEGSIFKAQILQYSATGESAAGPIEIPVSVEKGEWDEFSYIFHTAADVTQIAVYFENSASYVDVDNISVKPTSKYPVYSPEGTAVEIQNADFSKGLDNWKADGKVVTTEGFTGHGAELQAGEALSQTGVKLDTDSLYELHYYVKAVSADGCESTVNLIYKDENGETKTVTPYTLVGNSDAEGWKEITAQFETKYVNGDATLRLAVVSDKSASGATVAFDEIALTKITSYSNGLSNSAMLLAEDDEEANLFTNGRFILDTTKVAYGTADFKLQTGFKDGLFDWGNRTWGESRYTWVVEEGGAGTHGNAFKITGKGDATATSLLHTINWEAGKTYTVSYWLKTGNTGTPVLNLWLGGDLQRTVVGGGSGQIAGVVSDWTQYQFEYTATQNAATTKKNLTFSISLANSTESIYLADVKVVEKKAPAKRLDNGNFVDGTTSWTGFADANVVDGVANGAKSGKVLKVMGSTTIKHDAFTEPLVAGQKYTFKFRTRNNALSGAEIASVYFTSNNGKIIEFKLSATNGVWKEYVLDYVAKAGDETPQLIIDLASAQGIEFAFADFSFAEYTPILSNGDFNEDTPIISEENYNEYANAWTVFWLNKKTSANEGFFDGIVDEGGEHGKVMKISKNALDTQITDLRHTALSGEKKLTIGQSYKISFDIKTEGAYVSYSLQLRDGSDNGTIVAYTGGSTAGEWKTIEYEYVATEGYEDLQVWVRANPLSANVSSVTDYYIDNVKIERIDKTVKGDSKISNSEYTIMNGTYPEFWGLLGENIDGVSAVGGAKNAKVYRFRAGVYDKSPEAKIVRDFENGEWTKYTFDYTAKAAAEKLSFGYELTSQAQTVYLADVQIHEKGTSDSNLVSNGTFVLSGSVNYGDENFTMSSGLDGGVWYWPNDNAKKALTWTVVQGTEHGNAFKVTGSKGSSNYWLWQDVDWEAGKTYTISYWMKTGTAQDLSQEAQGYIDALNNSGSQVGASTLVPVYEGADYTLKFWLKANQTARRSFELRFTNYKDNKRTLIDGTATTSANIELEDTDEWQLVSVPFSIGKGSGYMDISFLVTAPGARFRLSGAEVILGEEAQKNASFEIGDVDSKPIGWSFSGAGTFTKQPGGVDGDYAGRISNGNTGHLTGANFEVEPGTYYEMSYWVKKDAPYDNIVYPYFKQLKEDGSSSTTANVSFPWTIRVYGSTNGEWKQVRYFFKTADDASAVTFNLVVSGAFQEVWIDDAKVVKKELIPNIDFEVADEDDNPEGWYLTDALDTDPEINVDTQYYHSGKQSVYLKVDSKIEEQKLVGAYRFPVAVEGDKRLFEHSFWVASRNANMKSVQLDLNFFDANGNSLVSGATRKGIRKTLNAGPEISEWSQVIVRSEIPRNAAYARLVFTFTQGTAELWIDDIFFDQVESDTEVVAAHNDFHAVDQNGTIEGWKTQGGTLVQKTDDAEGFSYGVLSGGTMSYTTDTLATEYQYKYTVRYKSDTHVNAVVRFYDYKRNEYKDLAVTKKLSASAGWTTAEVEFTAASCTTCDLVLGNGGELSVSQVVLYQTAKPSTKPSWTGKWISYRPDYRWCTEYNSSYYRKKITLDAEVTKAPFQITGDDKFALWVNGKEVYNNINDATGTWAAIQVLDLKEYLKVGDNIIAIEVYNQGAYSALIYDGIWTLANGKTVECISNAETLCLDPEPVGDWKSYNYDDSNWSRSMVAGNVPINPWGDIYFDATLYIDNMIEVEPVEGEGILVNDLEYEFSVKMKLKKKIDTQLPFNAVLWRRNSITSICTMPITLIDHQEMRNWPVGEWFTVKMKVELPDYLDDGNYTLQLSDEYFVIENEDVYDNKFISFKAVNDYVATERVTKVETINGVPTLTIDGAVGSQFWWKYGNNMSSALSTIGESDFEVYITQGIATGEGEGTYTLWEENGSFNYASMDKHLNTVLAASQKANVIVQIRLYAPSWWLEENPDEIALSVDSKGVGKPQVAASFGSEKWKVQAGELLKDIIAHMKKQKYYSRVVGIRLIAGSTDEFITYGTDVGIPDYSPAALEFFKKWAKEKYGTIKNLRKAWNDDTIQSFDSIEFPTYAEMNTDGGYGMMYNPKTQQKCIDFSNLLGEMTTDSMLYWAQIAKEATDNKLVVGAYYGYLFSGFAESTAPTALDNVLNSPYIDFLCGPQAYNERQLGESGTVQTVADTIRAYGKLCVNEQDNRTVLTNQFAGTVWDTDRAFSVGHTFTMQDTILQEKRDATYNIANGNASYAYDMQGGWMNEDQIFDLVSDINDEYYFAGHMERDLMNDVAVIIPDKNPAYIRYDDGKGTVNTVSNQTVISLGIYNWHRKQLAQMGAGYDIYALSTLEDGRMPTHKINIFFSPFYLSDEQRDLINQYCKNNGQINIFLYMSGLGAEDGNSVENMKELTGFDFELNTKTRSTGQIVVSDSGTSITEGLEGTVFGTQATSERYYVHQISVKDSDDQVVLGTLREDSSKIGFAMKDMGDWTSIYCAAPHLSANLYRNILKMAEAHIYSDNPADIIWSNSGYVGVHSATTGAKTIKLPSNYAVYDVFEEKFISMDTDTIEYENKLNDTHLFRLTPANTYSLLAYVKGGNGKLSETGLFHMKKGESKSIVITPSKGYMIKTVTINGEDVEVGTNNTVNISDIDSNQTLVVNFKRVPTNRTLDEDEQEDNRKEEENTITDNNNDSSAGQDTEDENVETQEGVKDAYQEIWATVREIISIPWWLLMIWVIGIGGVGFAIRFLVIKWKEKRDEK